MPTSSSQRWHVRLLSIAVTLLVMAALGELGARGLLALSGRSFSSEHWQGELAALGEPLVATALGTTVPLAAAAQPPAVPVAGRPEHTPAEVVAHPFFGFTNNPESRLLAAQQGRGALALDEHGFFRLPEDPAGDERPALRIAVVGGSLAVYFAMDGRQALVEALRSLPELRTRRLQFSCLALGGFKQPQMATALTYLLTLGDRYDLVLALDGLNDVSLPFNDWKYKHTFPAYPRDWDTLISAVPSVERLRRIGLVALLEQRRALLARQFDRPIVRSCASAALLWRFLDRRLSAELGAARAAVDAETQPAEHRYVSGGPSRHFDDDLDLVRHLGTLWANGARQMRHLVEGSGGRYFHFLQPNQYLPGSKPMRNPERAVAYRVEHPFRAPVELGYPVLRAEGARLRAEGLHFHDLTQLFATIPEPLYVDDCCHLNAAGSTLLGRAIGSAIVREWHTAAAH